MGRNIPEKTFLISCPETGKRPGAECAGVFLQPLPQNGENLSGRTKAGLRHIRAPYDPPGSRWYPSLKKTTDPIYNYGSGCRKIHIRPLEKTANSVPNHRSEPRRKKHNFLLRSYALAYRRIPTDAYLPSASPDAKSWIFILIFMPL